jgi:hypothetical protein
VVGKSEMSTARIMTLDVEDGVRRHRDSRSKGGGRWRNGTLTLKKDLVLLLVVERIGKKRRVPPRLEISSESGRQTMMAIIYDWFVEFSCTVRFVNIRRCRVNGIEWMTSTRNGCDAHCIAVYIDSILLPIAH